MQPDCCDPCVVEEGVPADECLRKRKGEYVPTNDYVFSMHILMITIPIVACNVAHEILKTLSSLQGIEVVHFKSS
jgi:hypothetical protein